MSNPGCEPTPTPIPAERFRQVLGHLPTGVTVVTAYDGGTPTGMAVNSVTSVSLVPPLILVCPAKCSTTWPRIRRAGSFCVNVMARDHEWITRQFARPNTNRFAGVATAPRPTGPALVDAVAWIDCQPRTEHEGGDHTIVVADVLAVEADPEVAPLVFFRGRYGGFAEIEASAPITRSTV